MLYALSVGPYHKDYHAQRGSQGRVSARWKGEDHITFLQLPSSQKSVFDMSEERTWDLSSIVADTSVAGIGREIDSIISELHGLGNELKGNLSEVSAKDLADYIRRIESLNERVETEAVYSDCQYALDVVSTNGRALGALRQKATNEFAGTLRTIEYDLGDLVRSRSELLDAPELGAYRHYLQKASMKASYRLSQAEENVIMTKDNNGIFTISQLRESWMGTQVLELKTAKEEKAVTMNELFSLRMDENRETRESASKAYFGCLAKDRLLHGTALQAVCADHVQMSKLRRWPSPMTQSLVDQDVEETVIGTMLSSIERASDSYQRYLRLKARFFGVERLLDYDIRAPWSSERTWTADWSSVRGSTISAYHAFDNEVGAYIDGLFDQRRIDSLDRKGRMMSKGFSESWFHGRTSFVFLTYNGMLNDAYTLAHELGHAVHNHFMHEHQSILNCDVSICMAETASLFGELLLTEQLLRECDTQALTLEILARVLDRFYTMVYYNAACAFFESSLYETIEASEMLDADKACQLWKTARRRIYGDRVEWTENTEYEWADRDSFYYPNFRFYNYSYSFAQLLVFALYGDFKKRGSKFNQRFKLLLSRGGSMSPKDQIAELGHDITKPDFWTLGIREAERFIEQLKKLI